MTPLRRQLKASMRAQRKALKASQRDFRARVAAMPMVKAAKRRRSFTRLLLAAVIALLLCFIRCDCDPGPAPKPLEADAGVTPVEQKKPVAPAVKPVKPGGLQGKVALAPRDGFDSNARTSPDWLDAFRLQVAARSPRLAECFQGTERPGALRWTCAVNPDSGAVSDQLFEPVGVVGELTKEQKACLTRVLSSPPYKVTAAQPNQALPNRVSMVIEF